MRVARGLRGNGWVKVEILLSRPREGLDIAERLTMWRKSLPEDVP